MWPVRLQPAAGGLAELGRDRRESNLNSSFAPLYPQRMTAEDEVCVQVFQEVKVKPLIKMILTLLSEKLKKKWVSSQRGWKSSVG